MWRSKTIESSGTMLASRRGAFPIVRLLAGVVGFYFIYRMLFSGFSRPLSAPPPVSLNPLRFGTNNTADRPCPEIPGMEDILVVMKTAANEVQTKLPPHFTTTLRCVPHLHIVSDLEEQAHGHQIHDVLRSVSAGVRKNAPEMQLYNKLRQKGRKALDEYDWSKWESTKEQRKDNRDSPAHKLDKWKFLPMAASAYEARPTAKWYVFTEADTYLSWPNVAKWVSQFDASQPHYMGSQMQIGDVIFAFGGTGFAISNPALKSMVEYRKNHLVELEEYTQNGWAGDEILGYTLLQVGVKVLWAYPNAQMSLPEELTYLEDEYDKRLWCYAPIGWHRIDREDLESLYSFDLTFDHSKPLLHRDVFLNYILPQIEAAPERDHWESLSDNVHGIGPDSPKVKTIAACRALCVKEKACKQYTFGHGICRTSTAVRLGHAVKPASPQLWAPTHSGWLVDRVHAFASSVPSCREGPWVLT